MWKIRQFMGDQRGGTAIEYGLILALVFLAMVGSVRLFAGKAIDMYNHVSNEVSNAGHD